MRQKEQQFHFLLNFLFTKVLSLELPVLSGAFRLWAALAIINELGACWFIACAKTYYIQLTLKFWLIITNNETEK